MKSSWEPGCPGLVLFLGTGLPSCMSLLLVAQAGGDTPQVVGHYIKCVSLSLSFVFHLLSEPLSRTGKRPSFLRMTERHRCFALLGCVHVGGAAGRATRWGCHHFSSHHRHRVLNHHFSSARGRVRGPVSTMSREGARGTCFR